MSEGDEVVDQIVDDRLALKRVTLAFAHDIAVCRLQPFFGPTMVEIGR